MADANEKLRSEFNQWALQGRGEEMENHHIFIAEQTIAGMALKPGERVLDLSCGVGWATRLLAQAVEGGQGMAVGVDVSDEMIARARSASRDVENVLFTIGSADEIPWRDEYFEKVLSIESFYYYHDQEAVLRELYRVLVPGGSLFILINLVQGESIFAALGRGVEGSGTCALGGRICGDAARRRICGRPDHAYSRSDGDTRTVRWQLVCQCR